MPFVQPSEEFSFIMNDDLVDEDFKEVETDFFEEFEDFRAGAVAGFKLNSTYWSAINNPKDILTVDLDFRPWDRAEQLGHLDTIYAENSTILAETTNSRQYDIKIAQIKRENEIRKVQAANPWGAFVGSIAGDIDFDLLLPSGAFVKTAKAGKIGYSLLKTATSVGAATGVAIAAKEVVLQNLQATRTLEESFYNIGGGVVFGAAIGAAGSAFLNRRLGKKLAKDVADNVGRKIEEDFLVPGEGMPDKFDHANPAWAVNADGTISKVNADGTTSRIPADPNTASKEIEMLEDIGLGDDDFITENIIIGDSTLQGALGGNTVLGSTNPGLRIRMSDNKVTKDIAALLAETPVTTKGNLKGQINAPGGTTETLINLRVETALGQYLKVFEAEYLDYRLGKKTLFGGVQTLFQDVTGASGGKLSRTEFAKEVAHAARNKDVHNIPQVQNVAKFTRETVFNPPRDMAIDINMFQGIETAEELESYLTRLFDNPKIMADERGPNNFLKIIFDDYKEKQAKDFVELDLDDTGQRFKEEYNATKADLRHINSVRKKKAKEILTKKAKLSEKSKQVVSQLEQAKRDVEHFGKRGKKLKPTEFANEEDKVYFTSLLKDLQKGEIPPTASPIKILQGLGGIKDLNGEILSIIGAKSVRPGLINDKSIWGLDSAAWALQDAGYFIRDREVDINELLNLIKESHNDPKLFPEFDLDEVAIRNKNLDLEDLAGELDAIGVEYIGVSPLEFMASFNKIKFNKKTPRRVGRIMENRRAIQRSLKQLESTSKKSVKVSDEFDDLIELQKLYKDNALGFSVQAKQMQKSIGDLLRKNKLAQKRSAVLRDRIARTDEEIMDRAKETRRRLLGGEVGRLPYDIDMVENRSVGRESTALGTPMRNRVWDIETSKVIDFVENDMNKIVKVYLNSMWPDVLLTERFGDVNMTAQLKEIAEEASEMIAKAPTERAKKKIQNQRDQDIKDVKLVLKRLRKKDVPDNPNNILVRTGRVVRDVNVMAMLGGMAFAAVTDIGKIVTINKLSGALGDGLVPLFTDYHNFMKSAADSKLSAIGYETVTNARANSMNGVMDDGGNSIFERALHGMTRNFAVVALQSPWNDVMKTFSAVVTQTHLLRGVEALVNGTATKKQIIDLAEGNIEINMAKRINAQRVKYGKVEKHVWWGNIGEWTDLQAKELYSTAVLRTVNRTIVTVGAGDLPSWMSSELGKQLGQFQSFGFASVSRTMLSGLQKRDMTTLNSIMIMLTLGGMVWAGREGLAGREIDFDNKALLFANAFDRSGLGGWLVPAYNMAHRGLGVGGLIDGNKGNLTRYRSRNNLGAFLGPSAASAENFLQISQAFFNGEWRASDIKAGRRIAPYNNVIYFKNLVDAGESGINNYFGLK